MVLVDERIGSKDLVVPLRHAGVPVELAHLESADIAFVGRGVDDAPITIGIELKRIRRNEQGRCDLIESLKSDRFAGHQLPLLQTYDRCWLLTEGLWRTTGDGNVETYDRGRWSPLMDGRKFVMMRDLEMRLQTLLIRGGLSYWHCPTSNDTVRFISVLFHWWTDRALHEHRSHQAIYIAPPDRAWMVEPSDTLKMLSCLPGVGWDRAGRLEARFPSIAKLVHASSKEIQTVDGIGKKIADGIHTTLWNGEAITCPE